MSHVVSIYRRDGILLTEYTFSGPGEARRFFAFCKVHRVFTGTMLQLKERVSPLVEYLVEIYLVEKNEEPG